MEYLPLGTKLKATSNCKMNDGSGNALIEGKEYVVIFHSVISGEIAVESELFPQHFFSIHPTYNNYWKKYFIPYSDLE